MKNDRTVLLANAGSGKTFTLANRVLAWCIAEMRAGRPAAPADILAVTFTRKAAGEILARIVSHAALGARDDEKGAATRREFAGTVGDATCDEYRAVLSALCDDLHRMQVGTIDGYLHRVATSMPEELGLPVDWTIAEPHEMEEIHAVATAKVLADPAAESLLDLLEDGAPKPSVGHSIEALLGESAYAVLTLYRATALGGDTAFDRAWGWAHRLRTRKLGGQGSSRKSPLDVQLDQLIAELEAAPLATNAKGEEHSSWRTARQKVVSALREGRVCDAGTTFVTGILEKGKYGSGRAPDELIPILQRVALAVQSAYLNELVARIDGALQAMPIAESALRDAQESRALYSFADVGRAVAIAARNPSSRAASAAELRAALGSRVRALAIDEAQDTSVAQFRALRPLIDEVLGVPAAAKLDANAATSPASHERVGGKFLLVGDPKQSIYGWRGGVPGQIDRFRREVAALLDPDETLAKSYRSSPLVLEFVNVLFGSLEADVLPLLKDEDRADLVGAVDFLRSEGIDLSVTESAFKRALAEWKFIPHEAAKLELPGWMHCYAAGERVAMDSTPEEDVDVAGADQARESGRGVRGQKGNATTRSGELVAADGVEQSDAGHTSSVAESVAKVVAKIHRERPAHTVAVLVRDNKALADIVADLKAAGIDASDEGRSTLLDSPPVVLLVNLLRLIDSPSDRVSHFVVSRSVLAAPLGLSPSEQHPSAAEADVAAARFACVMRTRIAQEGIGAFLQSIFRMLDSCALAERDRIRLARAISIGELFDAKPPARLTEIVTAIASDESGSGSSHPVRVMTVHASKGLEFDEVVLASLHAPWDKKPTGWGMLVSDPSKEPDMVGPLMNNDARHWIPELELLIRDNMRRAMLDEVSGLYVAITRAKRGLHCVFDQEKDLSKASGAGLIARVLQRLSTPETLPESPAASEVKTRAEPVSEVGSATSSRSTSVAPSARSLRAPIVSPSTWRASGEFGVALRNAVPGSEVPFWAISFAGGADGSRVTSAHPTSSSASNTLSTSHGSECREPHEAATPGPLFPLSPREHPAADSTTASSGHTHASAADSVRAPSEHRPSSPWAQDPFGDDDIALRGVLVHEYFREMRSIDEIASDPQAVAAHGSRLRAAQQRASVEKGALIGSEVLEGVSKMLRHVIAGVGRRGSVAEALRVDTNDEVRTEVPFVRALQPTTSEGHVAPLQASKPMLVHGRIDRLVLTRNAEGRVVRAVIMDFKTGAANASADALASKVALYRAQLDAYRDAVAELWSLPRHAVATTLLFVDRDEVVELAPSS